MALNFPDGPDDHEAIRCLRLALSHPELARLIRAAQDVVTLLASRGIYMDDIQVPETDPALWRADGTAWTVSDVPLLDELGRFQGFIGAGSDLTEQRRAEAVRRFMSREGIALNRIATISYGDTAPVAPNNTREGRAQNRRVAIVVLS